MHQATRRPVEQPELVRMILSWIPVRGREAASLVNRTWNANADFIPFRVMVKIDRAVQQASMDGHIAIVERLLRDPRIDPSADNNRALINACVEGHTAVVDRLLQDSRVDPSFGHGYYVIRLSSERGHISVVNRLLQDHRVDPSAGGNMSLFLAGFNGHTAVVDRLLQDPRVDPSILDQV